MSSYRSDLVDRRHEVRDTLPMRRIPTPPKCLALLPCESASRDGGVWSVRSIFDEMELDQPLPSIVPKFDVFMDVARGDADKETVYLALVSPDGQIIMQSHISIEWNNTPHTAYSQTFHAVLFRKAGDYTLRLFVEGLILAERVMTIKPPPQSGRT
jgi:hypothetical protein